MTPQRMAQRQLLVVLLLWVPLVPWVATAATRTPPPLGTAFFGAGRRRTTMAVRGGAADASTTTTTTPERELTLEEKVHAAMTKLGLKPPPRHESPFDDGESMVVDDDPVVLAEDHETTTTCSDGVCAIRPETVVTTDATTTTDDNDNDNNDPQIMADRIAETMNVDKAMVWAALGATSTPAPAIRNNNNNEQHHQRIYHEHAARNMIALELEMIAQIRDDSEEVQQLVEEGGWDRFLVRRALAFAERNVADARAILMADDQDDAAAQQQAAKEAEEEEAMALQQQQQSFPTVAVDADFDPTQISATASDRTTSSTTTAAAQSPPASKESVVFDATTALLQQLVLESPVPVLLDIYADWCGPCKALSPILEDIAIKSGGALRLVKVNSDKERVVATTLQVSALPTIFGVRDGRIVHMFQGMPKSETMLRNFLMGLLIPGGTAFDPPVTPAQEAQYGEWSQQLAKVAGSAAFSFAARERLQDRVGRQLDQLVAQCCNNNNTETTTTGSGMDTVEQAVKTVRALVSNVLRDPYNEKFRSVHLNNKVLAAKVAPYSAAVGLLKVCGFPHPQVEKDGSMILTVGSSQGGPKMINVAPFSVARDALDQWIERTRYEVAKATRLRRDEEDRVQVAQDLAIAAQERARREQQEAADAAAKAQVDPNLCLLKLRLDGKQKMHEVSLHADRALSAILELIPGGNLSTDENELQITCVAKRLTVSSTDEAAMQKSLRDHGLLPAATLVVKIKTPAANDGSGASSLLSQRAAAKKKKKGSHTMQSVGIYGRDDNLKGELIDGGGGTLYEHDVTDDEADEEQEVAPAANDEEEEEEDDEPAAEEEEMEQSTAASEAEADESIQDHDEE